MSRRLLLSLGAAALALCACKTVGPDYAPPELPTPARFASAAEPGETQDLSRWWRRFGDPELDGLVERALAQNLDLKQAASRIREARLQARIAGARDEPQLNAQASAGRQRVSENAIVGLPTGGGTGGGTGGFGLPGTEFNQFRLGLDASWEIDLWGATRRGVEAADARVEAAAWSARDLQVSLAAEVATNYLQLRALQRREAVARAELERQQALLGIIQSRAHAGFTSQLEPEQQRALIASTAATIPPLHAQQHALIHSLGVLTGQSPEALIAQLSSRKDTPVAAPPPPGLPSELLLRRPDLRAAERRLAAATADVGVATADLYPRFSLTAQPALVSSDLSHLLDWGSRSYSVGAGLVWPLLNGGRTRANIAITGERREQALLAYRQAVLRALRDVEDALTRIEADSRRRDELLAALRSAQAAVDIARDQARSGLVESASVLNAQAAVLQAQDQLAQTEGQLAQDTVALVKALGGGWEGSSCRPEDGNLALRPAPGEISECDLATADRATTPISRPHPEPVERLGRAREPVEPSK